MTGAPSALGPDALVDAEDLDGADLTGVQAGDARVLECSFTGCVLDEVSLRRARLVDTTFTPAGPRRSTWPAPSCSTSGSTAAGSARCRPPAPS